MAVAKVTALATLSGVFASYISTDYTTTNWNTLTGYNAAGIVAINAASDLTGVNTALNTATGNMAGVETIAQTLAAAKVTAIATLSGVFASYDSGDYSPTYRNMLTGYNAAGIVAINAASDLTGVATALGIATGSMAGVPTIAEELPTIVAIYT